MILFIHEGRPGQTDAQVKLAAAVYAEKTGIALSDELIIERTEKGKPFFVNDQNVYFSVSHSGDMWVCLMADSPVGVDIQEVRTARTEELAQRYFTEQEKHYVDLWGEEGFYDLWVRKEALVKYFGLTMAQGISGFEVAKNGDLPGEVCIGDEPVKLTAIEMGPYVKCAYAHSKDEEVEIEWI